MQEGSREAARFRIADMLRAAAYPHPVGHIELAETHVSWVVLTGLFAYKIKKPVRFDFLDCSTLEKRRALCEEELRLNRRLAAGLYLEVTAIGTEAGELRIGAQEDVVEYAVRMRQFDRSEELSALLDRAAVAPEELADLGTRLADFHAHAGVAAPESGWGSFAQLEELLLGNLASLRATDAARKATAELERLDGWLRGALREARGTIERRRADGRVRECHGDLHARNVVRWQGRLLPFDCLEFDAALRWIDVASELAFLYMDLLGRGRGDLAASFLSAHLEAGGDYEALRLLGLFAVHRALVRAKIDGLQAGAGAAAAAEFEARCLERIWLAQRLAAPSTPVLMLMHGSSGSGKSWLSERLVPALAALRVRSDVERKRLAGLGALERSGDTAPGAGLYGAEATARTYARLAQCAEHALAAGQDVIVDAAFLQAGQRQRFLDLARERGSGFLIVSCTADPAVLRARIEARSRSGRDASEASIEVLEHQLAAAEPLTAEEHAHALCVDTSELTSAAAAAEDIRRRLAAARPGLTSRPSRTPLEEPRNDHRKSLQP